MGLGLMLAARTIAQHGTQEQIGRSLKDIVTGQRAGCQLLSERAPVRLAGLATKPSNRTANSSSRTEGMDVRRPVADMASSSRRTDASVAEAPGHQRGSHST